MIASVLEATVETCGPSDAAPASDSAAASITAMFVALPAVAAAEGTHLVDIAAADFDTAD